MMRSRSRHSWCGSRIAIKAELMLLEACDRADRHEPVDDLAVPQDDLPLSPGGDLWDDYTRRSKQSR